jgi:GNAT superfamily N-acetyltransferase
MKNSSTSVDIAIRPYREEDEDSLLRLLDDSLGTGPIGPHSREFFRWKHIANPFGRSLILVAEADGRMVGARPFMRWRFRAGARDVEAVRAVDTATHPDYQGMGIFSRLTRAALDDASRMVELVFNTPNDKSGPGYLKLGWQSVGNVPIAARLRRPIRVLRRRRLLGEASEAVDWPAHDSVDVATLLDKSGEVLDLLGRSAAEEARLHTVPTIPYLRWRYVDVPAMFYRAVSLTASTGLRGMAIFRVRSRGDLLEAVVDEVFVRSGDTRSARRLLREVSRVTRTDLITCAFAPRTTSRRAALHAGFLRTGKGMFFVVNPLHDPVSPDPTQLGSWALTLGDLEMF